MRLKTFQASTMSAAMQLIREQLGADAIIVATHDEDGGGVRVTAAIDDAEIDDAPPSLDAIDIICETLDRHGTPVDLSEQIMNIASMLSETDPLLSLGAALDDLFKFTPLPDRGPHTPIALIGPPGVGKTACIAKLAARARLSGNQAHLITTDTIKAGATEQLSAYATRLGLTLTTATKPKSLSSLIAAAPKSALILIDTPATNPYEAGDIDFLTSRLAGVDITPVLVMDAGRDANEAIDLARAFKVLRPSRLLITGLDLVKRLGGMLALSDASQIPFCDVSPSPEIADGLRPINPVSLARLLMPEHAHKDDNHGDNAEEARTT